MLLVLGAFLVWPRRPSLGAAPEEDLEGIPAAEQAADNREASTVDDAADALVLCALALRAGVSPIESLEKVATATRGRVGHALSVVAAAQRWGEPPDLAWSHVDPVWHPAAVAWSAAHHAGAAPAGLLDSAAGRVRERESARLEAAIQRSGVLLVLPLGLCFLPGFICTTVLPVVLRLARGILG